jgi:F-type H+-transporting ATPase subunit b
MRTLLLSLALLASNAGPLLAQETEQAPPALMDIRLNLMLWTLVIFLILFYILKRWAFPAILGAVEKREQALQEALESARKDREEAQRLVEEQRRRIEEVRGDAQRIIAEGRAVAEKMRTDLIERTHQEQQAMLESARRQIETEKERAVAQLRREAVNLAIAGAGKVIEQNLDDSKNRQLVESYLASLPQLTVTNA